MKKYLVQAAFQSSYNKNKYSMYIGRWQPWHAGHRWLIDQRLEEDKNIWIAIRNIPPDEKNPWTAEQVLQNLQVELNDLIEEGRVVTTIVPDIESINIGRGVGYDVIEHCPPDQIKEISATAIRNKMKQDGKL
jgi:nicotinamide mononucleotide adenylyltransferase